MLLTNIDIFFLNPFSDPLAIIAKEVTPVRGNTVCVVARIVFALRCARTTGRCNVFQNIFGNQEKPEFYSSKFQATLFLMTIK